MCWRLYLYIWGVELLLIVPVQKRFLIIVLTVVAFAFGESPSLALPEPLMAHAVQMTERSMALDYAGAMELAKKVRASDDGVGCVLENIVRVSRYDDLGDTTAQKLNGKRLGEETIRAAVDAFQVAGFIGR